MYRLEQLKGEISSKYAEGKISLSNYEILNKRISDIQGNYNKSVPSSPMDSDKSSSSDKASKSTANTSKIKKYTSDGKPIEK